MSIRAALRDAKQAEAKAAAPADDCNAGG